MYLPVAGTSLHGTPQAFKSVAFPRQGRTTGAYGEIVLLYQSWERKSLYHFSSMQSQRYVPHPSTDGVAHTSETYWDTSLAATASTMLSGTVKSPLHARGRFTKKFSFPRFKEQKTLARLSPLAVCVRLTAAAPCDRRRSPRLGDKKPESPDID